MTEIEWKERCAASYVEKAGLTAEQASGFANACFENLHGTFSTALNYSPEDCADEDMSYWGSEF